MPAAHGDKGLGFHAVAPTTRLPRRRPAPGFLQDRRAAADLVIDLARHRRAPPRDQPRQRQAHNRRQGDDGRIGKQIAQERLDRLRRIRSAQIEQDDRELHAALRTRATSCSTWAIGVSGRMPWPRLKMKRPCRAWLPGYRSTASVQRRAAGDQGDRIEIALQRTAAKASPPPSVIGAAVSSDDRIHAGRAAHRAHSPARVAARGKPMIFALGMHCAYRGHDLLGRLDHPALRTALPASPLPSCRRSAPHRRRLRAADQMEGDTLAQDIQKYRKALSDRDRPTAWPPSVRRRPRPPPDRSPRSRARRQSPAARSPAGRPAPVSRSAS